MSNLEGGGIQYTVKERDSLSKICAAHPELGYSKWQDLLDANIDEISRVGRERMAAIGVGESITRMPCGLSGHTSNSKHFIEAGVHYDEVGVPTIYPGTTFLLRKIKIQNRKKSRRQSSHSRRRVR